MTWGLWFLNKNAGWQLDNVHPVKSFRQKGSFAPVVQNKPQWFTVTFTSPYLPWIALRGVNCHAAVEYRIKSGNSWTFHIFCVAATAGASLNWYVFDRCPPTPRTTGWGWELCDPATGEVVASDAYPPIRFIDIVTDPADYGNPRTYPAGRTYAQVATSCLWQNRTEVEEPTFGPPTRTDFFDMGGWRWQDNVMSGLLWASDQAAAHSASDSSGFPPTLIVVDVTNL